MNAETYFQLIQKPESLQSDQVAELKKTTEEFPFFQSARVLYLKGLKNSNSFRYNYELKITAAHTTDRNVLFEYITSTVFEEKSKPPNQEESFKIVKSTSTEIKSELEIGKPLPFSKKEKHSFNEWLQLTSFKPIDRKSNKPKAIDQESIINKFIQTNPKIVPINKDDELGISIHKNKEDKSLMTATLAKVYLEQKKYSKAIKAYEILSLKYPEKSGFFADQIERIKILKQKKS